MLAMAWSYCTYAEKLDGKKQRLAKGDLGANRPQRPDDLMSGQVDDALGRFYRPRWKSLAVTLITRRFRDDLIHLI